MTLAELMRLAGEAGITGNGVLMLSILGVQVRNFSRIANDNKNLIDRLSKWVHNVDKRLAVLEGKNSDK